MGVMGCINKMSECPRKKYLCTLSELLSTKLVMQPESQITKRLFPSRQFSRKLSLTHQRIKSSIEIRTQKYSHPPILPQHPPHHLAMHHKPRDTLSVLPRSISTQVMTSTQQIKMYSSEVLRDRGEYGVGGVGGVRDKGIMRMREQKKEQKREQKMEQVAQEEKRVFLRKGSSLQKQIVLNLLKSKMRESAEECSNNEIMRLIRVYRGESENGKRGKESGRRGKIDRIERGIGAWESPLEVGVQVGPVMSPLIGG